ncbi:dnaJ homolog subfamily C member 15 isoform X4 [Phacochoerus africanus]|uniref:dnaJ homolog subfamily C member 15 isoform X4 n=1 Tax=Phacochoerus africanus TaxID=41426 RepID=UPI001FDABCC7|nr:dnaJ homolog subfamily C member 15 isoform X4 [Phacochoerus africanus]XP_047611608.1 dnaJ homolog subfamily C member 15 isoform X4 [Phacochoerus africanus]XP_047611609.1 dnaJ homolog subfamily C member 15 isoform X4 [Phacochoerus africanus]
MRPRVEDDRRVLHRPTSVSKATVGAWLTHRTHSTPRILAPSPKRSIKREQDTSAQRRPLRPAASHLAAAVSTKVQGPLYSGPRVDGDERGSRQRARQKAGGPVAQQDEAQGGEDAWTLTLGFDELSWPSPGRLVGSAALGSPPPAPTWPQRHGWPRRRLTCRRGPALRRVLAAPSEAVGHGHRPGTGKKFDSCRAGYCSSWICRSLCISDLETSRTSNHRNRKEDFSSSHLPARLRLEQLTGES